MGVWIETAFLSGGALRTLVTPYVGVWIETQSASIVPYENAVTPYVGVWIETEVGVYRQDWTGSHSLCGSVD